MTAITRDLVTSAENRGHDANEKIIQELGDGIFRILIEGDVIPTAGAEDDFSPLAIECLQVEQLKVIDETRNRSFEEARIVLDKLRHYFRALDGLQGNIDILNNSGISGGNAIERVRKSVTYAERNLERYLDSLEPEIRDLIFSLAEIKVIADEAPTSAPQVIKQIADGAGEEGVAIEQKSKVDSEPTRLNDSQIQLIDALLAKPPSTRMYKNRFLSKLQQTLLEAFKNREWSLGRPVRLKDVANLTKSTPSNASLCIRTLQAKIDDLGLTDLIGVKTIEKTAEQNFPSWIIYMADEIPTERVLAFQSLDAENVKVPKKAETADDEGRKKDVKRDNEVKLEKAELPQEHRAVLALLEDVLVAENAPQTLIKIVQSFISVELRFDQQYAIYQTSQIVHLNSGAPLRDLISNLKERIETYGMENIITITTYEDLEGNTSTGKRSPAFLWSISINIDPSNAEEVVKGLRSPLLDDLKDNISKEDLVIQQNIVSKVLELLKLRGKSLKFGFALLQLFAEGKLIIGQSFQSSDLKSYNLGSLSNLASNLQTLGGVINSLPAPLNKILELVEIPYWYDKVKVAPIRNKLRVNYDDQTMELLDREIEKAQQKSPTSLEQAASAELDTLLTLASAEMQASIQLTVEDSGALETTTKSVIDSGSADLKRFYYLLLITGGFLKEESDESSGENKLRGKFTSQKDLKDQAVALNERFPATFPSKTISIRNVSKQLAQFLESTQTPLRLSISQTKFALCGTNCIEALRKRKMANPNTYLRVVTGSNSPIPSSVIDGLND